MRPPARDGTHTLPESKRAVTGPGTDAPSPTSATAHRISVELAEAFPQEIEAAADVSLRARIRCSNGCDLGRAPLRVVSAGEVVCAGELESRGAADFAEATLALKAPPRVGEWTCAVVVPGLVIEGVPHAEGTLEVTSSVLPHTTSLAVWGVPSPQKGSAFHVTVGVKCSAGCAMAGRSVEVLDEKGVLVGAGTLADGPRAGTSALYATDVKLLAPGTTGVCTRTVRFAGSEVGLPHLGASASFTFRSLDPPEHMVAVRLVPKGFEPRTAGIEVWIGAYRGETDALGVARVGVPKGTFELSAWRVDLEPASKHIEVTCDTTVELVIEPRRVVDEDAEHWG